jgi:hypothetical protein
MTRRTPAGAEEPEEPEEPRNSEELRGTPRNCYSNTSYSATGSSPGSVHRQVSNT